MIDILYQERMFVIEVAITVGFIPRVYIRRKYLSGMFCQWTLGVPDPIKVFYMIDN